MLFWSKFFVEPERRTPATLLGQQGPLDEGIWQAQAYYDAREFGLKSEIEFHHQASM